MLTDKQTDKSCSIVNFRDRQLHLISTYVTWEALLADYQVSAHIFL